MEKRKDYMILLVLVVLLFLLQTGCSGRFELNNGKSFNVVSKTFFTFLVPVDDSNICIQPMFFSICDRDDMLGLDEYIIGESALLVGENTEQLNGATVAINVDKLSDLTKVNNKYYKDILSFYDEVNGDKNLVSDVSDVKKVLKPYLRNAYVYSYTLSYDTSTKGITSPITVDKLKFNDSDFIFDFDVFEVKLQNTPKSNMNKIQTLFDSNLGGTGIWNGTGPSKAVGASAVLEGTALSAIEKIDVFGLDDSVVFATEENRELFEKYEEVSGTIFYLDQKSSGFSVGDKVELERQFLFSDELFGKDFFYDTASILYGVTFTDEKGGNYTMYIVVDLSRHKIEFS